MSEPEGIACSFDGKAIDLPHRTAVMIERDRGAVSAAAHTLHGTSDRGRGRTTPAVTNSALHTAAASEVEALRQAAAVLMGRCSTGDAEADARLGKALDGLAAESEARGVRVEAVVSQLLRGGGEAAKAALRAIAGSGEGDEAAVKAAAWLAQAGEASGWPAVVAGAKAEENQRRVGALDAAVALGPLQGEKVAGGEGAVDALGAIAGAIVDEAVTVRQNVPRWLVEVGHPEARKLIEGMIKDDASDGVRTMAEHALRSLGGTP